MMQFNFLVQLQLFLIFGSREFCPICVHKKEITGKIASLQEHSYWLSKAEFQIFFYVLQYIPSAISKCKFMQRSNKGGLLLICLIMGNILLCKPFFYKYCSFQPNDFDVWVAKNSKFYFLGRISITVTLRCKLRSKLHILIINLSKKLCWYTFMKGKKAYEDVFLKIINPIPPAEMRWEKIYFSKAGPNYPEELMPSLWQTYWLET